MMDMSASFLNLFSQFHRPVVPQQQAERISLSGTDKGDDQPVFADRQRDEEYGRRPDRESELFFSTFGPYW